MRRETVDRWQQAWKRGWMRWAGRGRLGRFANRMAALAAPPHKARTELAGLSVKGFISPSATLYHDRLELGKHVYIGDRVVLFQRQKDGFLRLGDRVCIHRDGILETGSGGSILVDEDVSIHPRCQINAFVANIEIGRGVMIAPNCALDLIQPWGPARPPHSGATAGEQGSDRDWRGSLVGGSCDGPERRARGTRGRSSRRCGGDARRPGWGDCGR